MSRVLRPRHVHLVLALIITAAFCLFFPNQSRTAEKPFRVLLICSYSPSFPTFSNQVDGIKSVFSGKPITLDIECMDAKRFPFQESLDLFANMLAYKFSRLEQYDAVMTADDSALKFVLSRKDSLLKMFR